MMQSPHYRKIELQSPADLTYLYTNTVALSRQKLDLHFPPSAYSDGDNPDPMKERVKELVDQFIRQIFTHASDSISINGLEYDSSNTSTKPAANNNNSGPLPFLSAFSAPETVEYEAYDSNLAARVSSLYAQLESLTTTVAQLRRDAPGKAARNFADALNDALGRDDAGFEAAVAGVNNKKNKRKNNNNNNNNNNSDNNNKRQKRKDKEDERDNQTDREENTKTDIDNEPEDNNVDDDGDDGENIVNPEWKLDIPFGSASERERWHSGEMAEVYADTLRTLLRLQGEEEEEEEGRANNDGDYDNYNNNNDGDSKAISTTVATAERAERAVEFVEKM